MVKPINDGWGLNKLDEKDKIIIINSCKKLGTLLGSNPPEWFKDLKDPAQRVREVAEFSAAMFDHQGNIRYEAIKQSGVSMDALIQLKQHLEASDPEGKGNFLMHYGITASNKELVKNLDAVIKNNISQLKSNPKTPDSLTSKDIPREEHPEKVKEVAEKRAASAENKMKNPYQHKLLRLSKAIDKAKEKVKETISDVREHFKPGKK